METFKTVTAFTDDSPVEELGPSEKVGTRADHRDMLRMGKNQELRVRTPYPLKLTVLTLFVKLICICQRNFRFISILGFTCILMSTWEGQLTYVLRSCSVSPWREKHSMITTLHSASTFGLINGGLAGLIWTYLGTFACFLAVIASMAEMASMAPTSGGQYHWVSEFAPASSQKFLSYITGIFTQLL